MKYSVIIPAYNAGKTIEKCVKSITSQSFEDYEIILINDGSEDNTAAVCESLAAENDKIVFVDMPHGGVSRARNAGLEKAAGDYVLFVDSDDYVSKNYFGAIESSLGDFDWLIFSKCTFTENATHLVDIKPFETKSRRKVLKHTEKLICNKVINSPCTKVYRRSVIEENGIRFPEDASMSEDKAFNINYALHAGSLKMINEALYFYNISNPDSLTRSKDSKAVGVDGYIESAVEKSDAPNKKGLKRSLDFIRYRTVYHYAKLFARSGMNKGERKARIKTLCDKVKKGKYGYPKTPYCLMICIPVRLKLAGVIDFVGTKIL